LPYIHELAATPSFDEISRAAKSGVGHDVRPVQ